VALLSFIGYTLMEMRYFLESWIPGDGAAMLETLVILLIVAGWLKALLVSAAGKRSGFIALLAFSLFATLIGLYDLQYLLNTPMPWPEQLMVLAMLGSGVISGALLALHIGRPRPSH
jgi:hypothetical protein